MPVATAPDGVRLYYEAAGAGEPLLLVAGGQQDHHAWDPLRGRLAARHRVLVSDHRGTGASEAPEAPPYAVAGFARDAVAVLDHAGAPRAHVVGHSMGGRVAQALALDHPHRLGALVLAATGPGGAHEVPGAPLPPAATLPALLELGFTPAWLAAHPEELAAAAARARRPPPDHARRLHAAASAGHDAWARLPAITAPTLVLHGSDDPLIPAANAALLAQRIPGAELHLVPAGRHAFHVEFAEEVVPRVLAFLARHPL